MDRRAIREGKRPMVSSPRSSDDEDNVPLVCRVPRPVRGIIIRDRSAASAQPSPRESPVRVDPPPSAHPAPPSAASSDLAGPAGMASTMTFKEIEGLRSRYRVPSFIRLFVPGPEDRETSDLPDRVALYEEFFRCGLRLPFHPFFLNLLDRYRLVPAKKLKVALCKRRQEAGKEMRPAKRARSKAQVESAKASKIPANVPSTAAATPTEEPSGRTPEEAPVGGVAPDLAKVGAEEGGHPAPPVDAEGEAPATDELMVVELDPEARTSATTELVEAGKVGNEGGPLVPPELETEEGPPMAGEGEATTAAGDAEVELAGKGGAELEDSPPPTTNSTIRRAVRKAPGRPPWLAPRLSSMEDAGQAERLLGRL